MKTIYKYALTDTIQMPYGAEILTAQTQYNNVFIWAIIDDEEKAIFNKSFQVFGTGHELPNDLSGLKYVNTCQLSGGNLVIHVFEVI